MPNLIKICLLLFVGLAQMSYADKYDDAVSDSKRTASDKGRDELREPAKILRSIGIESGQTVLDVMAGDGYYSQMLSSLVGKKGKVFIQNPSILTTKYYPQLVGAVAQRIETSSLDNLKLLESEATELGLEDNSVDVVFLHLVYHDLYWVHPDESEQFDAEFARVAKPGSRVVIIDHRAADGAGAQQVGTMGEGNHRIDANFVQKAMEKAGLRLLQSYDLLHNSHDDRTQPFFSEGLRGKKTDRFFQIYEKPLS